MTELGLRIPISGVQLIEASAGTGKTFTLATLYTRLVIEHDLPVASLLAVTYTEAAAKDLRDKLRERLARAALLLEDADASALSPRDSDGGADALSRTLLRGAVARGESIPALRQRLRAAVAQMDLAPIHTIHAFCQRALREHALEAGQPLATRALVANEAALRREVATEFWRRHAGDDEAVERLLGLWKSPRELAEQLPDLLGFDRLLPAPVNVDMRQARAALAAVYAEQGAIAQALVREAREGTPKQISADYDAARIAPIWRALERWIESPITHDPRSEKLATLGALALAEETLSKRSTPVNPLFAAIDDFLAAQFAARSDMVHAAVDFARARLAALKRERQLVGFDDLIRETAEALDGATGERFARALRRQYRIALVDEFQDTDPRQWQIFRTLFARPAPEDEGGARALILIGDPKQAIYRFRGGDVATYLEAQKAADGQFRLEHNFRSRPLALQAVEALFTKGGRGAFQQPGIEFEPVQPGGACRDEHFQLDGTPAPGLFVQQFSFSGGTPVEEVRAQCAANCVAAIHQLLSGARAGTALIGERKSDGVVEMRPVRPADITVLLGRNEDALLMQQALSMSGIPSVAAGRSSLYDSAEAQDLRAWLAALAAPADDGRLRALLATPLFGLDASAIAAFDADLAAHRHWQESQQHWLAHATRRGAMAALAAVCALESARLLAQSGGERRLSNYLQLVEELQAVEAGAIGIAGLLAELERRIEDADKKNDTELLRLESDSARVRIMTTHVSKGLNLDLVFVPFASLKPGLGPPRKLRVAGVHDGLERIGQLVANSKDSACQAESDEIAAEHVRVLYVALTRARFATWVGWGHCKEVSKTALAWLMLRESAQGMPASVKPALLDAAAVQLQALAPAAISMQPSSDLAQTQALPRLRFESADELPPARAVHRLLDRDWWVYSFSQLAREDSGAEEVRGAEDEVEPAPLQRSRFSGTRFGNALHGALEAIRFADWRDWRGALPPPGQLEPVLEALRREGFASDLDQEEGLPILTSLIGETVNAAMPEGTRLAWLAPEAMCVEMEFHFELAPVHVHALLELLHRHGVLPERRSFGQRLRLEGLLTGRIDLVYATDERFYVLDYKSNQLPDYRPETLARAVRESEYDLQYVLYTLALHRWLRFRIGAGYDIARHLGGVRYVFSRGLDRDDPDAPGIHALRLPDTLVLELDALLRRREAA